MLITTMLVAGLVCHYGGAKWLVRGGASLAVRLGVHRVCLWHLGPKS
ncbi:MAG TPA: hypothetical protein PKM73_02235 [Verrucomicrobiota bacterium]|nr:hypothetical protein [Verrucomicrobiota bacterium]HNU50372.1 hypothetical protein [Verrucomicrobiota bacterium]